MRGISKSWPPRDVYPDGHEPASFRQAENEYRAALPGESDKVSFARSKFDRLDKQKLRREMYREQRSLCVYCERRVAEGYPTPRIDHWRPLSLNPVLALHWKNLYLSCPSPDTCDSSKADRPLRWDDADPDMPWPADRPYEDVVGFTSGGEIYVRSDAVMSGATRRALELAIADRPDGARVRPGIVNLNHPALVAARAAAVDRERSRMERVFKNRTATMSERKARATLLLGQDPRPSFVSICVAWLCKEVGQGR